MSGYTFPVLGDYRISSPYGSRSSPGGIGSTNHRGIDIAAKAGTPIVAPIGGNVIFAGRAGGYGNYVKVRGDDGNTYEFGHLLDYQVGKGRIAAGEQIGRVGSTGNSTGNHLHFGVKNAIGKYINPTGILADAKGLLDKGANLLGIGGNAGDILGGVSNVILPGSGAILGAVGLGGDSCGIICQIQNWIKESGFFQRLALAILAFIVLASAFYMMKSGAITQAVSKVKGAIE